MVSLLFWLIFSILGVQLFSGKFQACVDHEGERVPGSVVPNKTECLRFPEKYVWKNSEANFDNVLNGFLALFLVVRRLLFIVSAASYGSRRIRLTPLQLVATQYSDHEATHLGGYNCAICHMQLIARECVQTEQL